jgi:Winged helix DNA-binding domain
MSMNLTCDSVLAWRMRQQFLHRPAGVAAVDIVQRLCGIQAQVAGCAEHAIAIRQASPGRGEVAKALDSRKIVKTWAMRGTLHLLNAADAASYLSLLAAPRSWEKGAWQRTFATAAQIAAITDAAREALAGTVLTREQLTDEIVRRTGDRSLREQLKSGWGAVLKPLAWQGYLINGPSDGNRVTFTSPETWLGTWQGLPEPDEAARLVIPAYLAAFGPASVETFDEWLIRGASRKASLRTWFRTLVESGELAQVEVDGQPAYARSADVDEIAATKPSAEVRLLDGFDQYVLGTGTANTQIIAAARRSEISKAAGWISPVVLAGGRVAGTWEASGSVLDVTLFQEAGAVSAVGLDAEAARIAAFLGTSLRVAVRTS